MKNNTKQNLTLLHPTFLEYPQSFVYRHEILIYTETKCYTIITKIYVYHGTQYHKWKI